MITKHTPGRWWVSGEDNDEVHCSIFVQDMDCNMHIALVKPPCVGDTIPAEQLKANAHLIAAAPELLEALTRLVGYIGYGSENPTEKLDAARAAIAKAIG